MYYVLKFLGDTLGSCSSQRNIRETHYLYSLKVCPFGERRSKHDLRQLLKQTIHNISLITLGTRSVLFLCMADASLSAARLFARPKAETADEKSLDHTVTFPAFEDLN